jgi:hypothetical protein
MSEGASALPWGVRVHLIRRPGSPSTHPFRSDDRVRALARGRDACPRASTEGQKMPRARAEPGAPPRAALLGPAGRAWAWSSGGPVAQLVRAHA